MSAARVSRESPAAAALTPSHPVFLARQGNVNAVASRKVLHRAEDTAKRKGRHLLACPKA